MAQTIKLKRSAVAGRIPRLIDLDLGEVAINTTDGKMYMKKSVSGVESLVEVTSAQLPTDPTFNTITLNGAPGPIEWNSDESTVDVPLNSDVTLQMGQETLFYAKATEAISNGDVVMFAGAQGDHLMVSKADMSLPQFEPEYVIGVATQDFALNDFGFVTTFGKVRGLNTAQYTEGDVLYLDPNVSGGLTTTRPTPTDHIIQMCAVTRAHLTEGTFLVRPTHFHDTDEVPEGSSNLYFTDARAVSAVATADQYVKNTGDTMTGDLVLNSKLHIDTGDNYRDISFEQTGSLGNGTLELTPGTMPGSGIANYYTYFKNKGIIGDGGATRHSVKVDGYLTADRLYAGDGTNGYFYSDTDGRTAFANGDLYIQQSCNTYYNYANVQYHGNSSGDEHRFRSNALNGTNWDIDTSGNLSALSFEVSGTTVIDTSRNISGNTISVTNDGAIGNNLYVGSDDDFIRVGGGGGGKSGVFGNRMTNNGSNLSYGAYLAYDAYWNGSAWAASRPTLSRKWMTHIGGYHDDNFHINRYGNDASGTWADGDWTRLLTLSSAGSLNTLAGYQVNGTTLINSSRSSLYLNSSNVGEGRGIFFRDGFGVGNYNCSITVEDNSGNFPDGLHISGYDGVTIGTGSNERVSRLKIDQAGDTTLYGNLKINGTTVIDSNRNLLNISQANVNQLRVNTSLDEYPVEIFTSNYRHAMRIRQDSGSGYAPASILLQAEQSGTRASGIFCYNIQTDKMWYSGTAYADNTEHWGIHFKSGSDPDVLDSAAAISERKWKIDQNGNTSQEGSLTLNDHYTLEVSSSALASTTQTAIATFPIASFSTAKIIVQAKDTVTDEIHASELLIIHDGTTAISTEYAMVYSGAAPLATYDVDISGSDVRVLATSASTNNTTYKTTKNLIKV